MASHNQENNLSLGDYLKEVSDGLVTFYKQGTSNTSDPQNAAIEELANTKGTSVNNKEESLQINDLVPSQQEVGVTAVQVHGNESGQDNDTMNQHKLYEKIFATGLLHHHTSDQAAKDINSRSGNDDNRSVGYTYSYVNNTF